MHDYEIIECNSNLTPVPGSTLGRECSLSAAFKLARKASSQPSEYHEGKASIAVVERGRVIGVWIGGRPVPHTPTPKSGKFK